MRQLNIGSNRFTKIIVMDEPGQGGACHDYQIHPVKSDAPYQPEIFGSVKFQNGPVNENGINGCHQEDLIATVDTVFIDRTIQ